MTDTGTVSITITLVNDNDPVANDDSITVVAVYQALIGFDGFIGLGQ
ncbi:MAG: hypothetical protein R3E68_02430 [Burkholderiaceae bacterium]